MKFFKFKLKGSYDRWNFYLKYDYLKELLASAPSYNLLNKTIVLRDYCILIKDDFARSKNFVT